MNAMAGHPQVPGSRGGFRGLAWLGALLATLAAAVVGTVLAVFFAATVVVLAVMGAAMVLLAGLAVRARRSVRTRDPQVIEAHNIGGHSWVAYGWDRRTR